MLSAKQQQIIEAALALLPNTEARDGFLRSVANRLVDIGPSLRDDDVVREVRFVLSGRGVALGRAVQMNK
jgi:hypothetical protein